MMGMSDELVASIVVGFVIPVLLKILQHFFPWLTINNSGTHTRRAPEDES